MATLETNLSNLSTRIATQMKLLNTMLNGNVGVLTALTTTDKANLVAAVNEVKAAITAIGTPATINDGVTNGTNTWSSTKITTQITAALNGVLSGAPAALDTLAELAAAISNDANFAASMTTALGNRVRFDAAQTLTAPQQAQAIANIGAVAASAIGNPDANLVTIFEAGLV